jgi:hypothetical protein
VRLYRRFREYTRGYYDREDLAQSATGAVKSGKATGLPDLGFIAFFQVQDITPAERELIEVLASCWSCAVFLGLSGDSEADAPVESLAERLTPALGTPERAALMEQTSDMKLVIAPDPHEEIRWVIRHILRCAEEGVPLSRMAVLYRKHDTYAALIREEMALAGLPVAGPNPTPLSDTAAGRALLGLLRLSGEDFSREGVMAWLTGCPVRHPKKSFESFRPARWDAISKRAGIVRGLGQWRERLARYASETARQAQRAEARNEASWQDSSSWRGFSRWAVGLLDRYLIGDSELPEAEQQAASRIRDRLQELEGLDRPGGRAIICELLAGC